MLKRGAEYKRGWRAQRAAAKFVLGLAEAELDWTGIHVLRGMLAANAYERTLAYSRVKGAKKRAADPDACRAYNREKMREYRDADPEKFRARSRNHYHDNPSVQARVKAQARAWVKANPLAKQIDRLNYARRAAYAPGKHTAADLVAQFNAQGGACFYCAKPLTRFHIEHKTPLSRGGTNNPDNIVCACARCNLRKGPRTAEQFFAVLAADVEAKVA